MRAQKPDERLPSNEALDFLQTLWRLNHAMERLSKSMEATLGVTAQQRMIIRWVGKYPQMTAGQLASHLHLDAGTVSAALGRLERKGLLERRRDDRDRRRVALGLTAKGRALDHPRDGTVESAVARLMGDTAPSEMQTTRRTLEALTRAIDVEPMRVARPTVP